MSKKTSTALIILWLVVSYVGLALLFQDAVDRNNANTENIKRETK